MFSRPKSVEFKDIETEVIEPEDLEPRRIEFDRNLGTDSHQIQIRFVFLKILTNLEKLVQTRLTSSHRCIPITS